MSAAWASGVILPPGRPRNSMRGNVGSVLLDDSALVFVELDTETGNDGAGSLEVCA